MTDTQKQHTFLALLEPEHQALSDYCRAVQRNLHNAEDLMSDTLLVAFENINKLRDRSAFRSYLFGIACRLSKKRYRNEKKSGEWNDEKANNLISNASSPDANLDVQALYNALDQLPEKQKNALILFEINGFSIREVSEIQNCSEDAVKQRLKRGREKLAKRLGAKNE
ncbi:RNA polymerase sigma factor [Saccharicrinis sp. FJH62]|uniref:RNA polymerase sigma factor n=1 Tax=Saccharicrinis sp. FJH62 TaxID=3344657 RepID=UPI0035D462A8